jgi:signal transduction histidine kinase
MLVRCSQGLRFAAALLLLGFVATDSVADAPQRVLVIHSFSRDMEPYGSIDSAFRTALAQGAKQPVAIHEAALDAGQADTLFNEELFIAHLRDRFRSGEPDLVVTFGPPAGRFYAAYRERLFPERPFVMAGLEYRLAPISVLRPGDAAVTSQIDFTRLIDHMARLIPDLRNVVVILGDSPLERFWGEQMRKEFAPLSGRLRFDWLVGKTLDQMARHVAALPPGSAVFYASLRVDAAGVPYTRQVGLGRINAATKAPIFGLYETEIGNGVVGGPYQSQRRRGEFTAQAALQALSGERGKAATVVRTGFEPPVYDWRELRRWKIDESRLLPDAEVRFREPSVWQQHEDVLGVVAAALLLQAALITALLFQRGRARRAEREALTLGGQLITAHEDERRRIARELHDDVTQRLARLSIDAARIERRDSGELEADAVHALRESLVSLSEDVHALTHQLHPAVLEDLGLAEALKAEGERLTRREAIECKVQTADIPTGLSRDIALCLFRVAQEALRNVARHAAASVVDVRLARRSGGIELRISDNGSGFESAKPRERPGLGLASMRERVRLLHGKLDITSQPNAGTTIVAWVPLQVSS